MNLLKQHHDLRQDLRIKLVGKVDFSVNNSIALHGLTDYIEKIDYIPHTEVVKVQRQSQVLLLLINNTPNSKSILTGKLFEYLAAQRPILCIGPPDGDAAVILKETNAGVICDFNDLQKAKENILLYYDQYKKGNLTTRSHNIGKYSRKALTGKLADVMNRVISS